MCVRVLLFVSLVAGAADLVAGVRIRVCASQHYLNVVHLK